MSIELTALKSVIELSSVSQVIELITAEASVIEITEAGTQGPPGPAGGSYRHIQSSPLSLWTIAHNLGRRPSVSVTTVGGVGVMEPEVLHLSDNTLTLTFDDPLSGEAHLT